MDCSEARAERVVLKHKLKYSRDYSFPLFLIALNPSLLPDRLLDLCPHPHLYYVIMAVTWNLLGGYTGQFSLSHHTFAMIGSYTSALLIIKTGIPLWMGMASSWIFNAFNQCAIGYSMFTYAGHLSCPDHLGLCRNCQDLYPNGF